MNNVITQRAPAPTFTANTHRIIREKIRFLEKIILPKSTNIGSLTLDAKF